MSLFYSLNESQRSLWLEFAPEFIRNAALDQSEDGKRSLSSLLKAPDVVLNLNFFVSDNNILIEGDGSSSTFDEANDDLSDRSRDYETVQLVGCLQNCAPSLRKDYTLNQGPLIIDMSAIHPFLRGSTTSQETPDLSHISESDEIIHTPTVLGEITSTLVDNQPSMSYGKVNHYLSDRGGVDPGIESNTPKGPATKPIFLYQINKKFYISTDQGPPPPINGYDSNAGMSTQTGPQICPWPSCPAPNELSSWSTLKRHQDQYHKQGSPYGFLSWNHNIPFGIYDPSKPPPGTIEVPPFNENGRIMCKFPGCINLEGLKTTQTYRTHMRKHEEDARKAGIIIPPIASQVSDAVANHTSGQELAPGLQSRYIAPPAFRNADGFYECQYPGCDFIPFKTSNTYNRHCDSVHSGKSAECPYCLVGSDEKPNGKNKRAASRKTHYYTRADAFQKHLKRIHPSVGKNHPVALEVIRSLRRGNGKGTTWDKTSEPAGKGFEGRDENGLLEGEGGTGHKRKRQKSIYMTSAKKLKLQMKADKAREQRENPFPPFIPTSYRPIAPRPNNDQISSTDKGKSTKGCHKRTLDFIEDASSDNDTTKRARMTHEEALKEYNLQEVAEYALNATKHDKKPLTSNNGVYPALYMRENAHQNMHEEQPHNKQDRNEGISGYNSELENQGGSSSGHQASNQDKRCYFEGFYNSPPFENRFDRDTPGDSDNHETEYQAEITDSSLDRVQDYLNNSISSNQRNEPKQPINAGVEYPDTQMHGEDAEDPTRPNTPDAQIIGSPFAVLHDSTYLAEVYQEGTGGALKSKYQPRQINTSTFHHGLAYHLPPIRHAYEDDESRSIDWANTTHEVFDPILHRNYGPTASQRHRNHDYYPTTVNPSDIYLRPNDPEPTDQETELDTDTNEANNTSIFSVLDDDDDYDNLESPKPKSVN